MSEPALRMQRSSRSPDEVRQRLQDWLATKLGADRRPQVSELSGTDANGMSSDTMLFRATWSDPVGDHDERLVARVAPAADDVPVFPSYDIPGQFETIRIVGEVTDVPVPKVWWPETDESWLGAAFFVMTQVDGLVPPDVMPYSFGDNWLFDAPVDQQRTLQDSTVDAIAALHSIPEPTTTFSFLERAEQGDSYLRRHVDHTRAWYDMVAREGAPSPLVERAFKWLDEHWPEHEGPPVLSWGDSRIGNVLYHDFRPAALLNWEMAGLGPAELDIAWLAAGHIVFQDLAKLMGLPGMPDFLTLDAIVDRYEAQRGVTVSRDDLPFYLAYAAVQWAIVFLRTGQRSAHFGERELPDNPEELIMNRALLESMIDN